MAQAPLTTEGFYVLHQMFRVRWTEWRDRPAAERGRIAGEATGSLREQEAARPEGQSAAYALLGHKGDLMLIHWRRSVDALLAAQLDVVGGRLARFLEPAGSYLSVIELGLYEATVKLAEDLQAKGIAPGSAEWITAVAAERQAKAAAMAGRLFGEIPARRYVCFYPMDKKREGADNWYALPIAQRAALMKEHGTIGRKYAGRVQQVISGSIGLDAWEWGVDLHADDPLVFKELVTEMRFDEASARYGAFGDFWVGVRVPAAELGAFLEGKPPAPSAQPS